METLKNYKEPKVLRNPINYANIVIRGFELS
jgi:hypothetical protein